MCRFQFVDDRTLDRIRQEAKVYRKNTPIWRQFADLRRSIGMPKWMWAFFWLAGILAIAEILYLLISLLA
jgi:hypothetical protein